METSNLNMEDFMDVVYKCKFCSYTCTQSPDMGLHVKEKHFNGNASNPPTSLSTNSSSRSTLVGTGTDPSGSLANGSVVQNYSNIAVIESASKNLTSSMVASCGDNSLVMQVTDELLSFTTEGSQGYDDKGLKAVPVSQGTSVDMSNHSTPDLTELISMVKPEEDRRPNIHFTLSNQTHLSLENIVQLPSSVSDPYPTNQSQPVAVMALQLPSMNPDEGPAPQYIVDTTPGTQDTLSMNAATETKEFLLCGLCKFAFTSMEDCQSHMQMEHRELMQGVGKSIGVQAGGRKRGRKRKGEPQSLQAQEPLKLKEEPYLDPDDLEWLPSVPEGNKTTHRDGRTRRKVIPPKALKEDYVLGRKVVKRRHRKNAVALGHNLLCPMMSCKARFKTKASLDIHLSSHNMDDSAFTCPECHASHDFWKHLRFHLWKVHMIDIDLMSCETCGYKTDTVRKMRIHQEIHTDDKPYTCEICGKGFRQASQQKNHMNVHRAQLKEDSKQWYLSKKCDICDRVFANSKSLSKHKEAVHSKVKPFECSFCNHTTSRKAMMQLHMRTHTGEKPFKCHVCPYTTGDHNSMRRHKMRHTGEKQYHCSLCMYTCIQSISLKQHMKNKHPGVNNGIFQCSRCPFRSINQNHYNSHVMDHKKGLIADNLASHHPVGPKSKRINPKSHSGSNKLGPNTNIPSMVDPAFIKHPQFHAVVSGDETVTELDMVSSGITCRDPQTEVFNMQVTMLPSGDTHVSADDMTRLSENSNLLALGIAPLQLIYATLSTISEQADLSCVEEGRSSLLTIELLGGIQTAVLSSVQEGSIFHSITYHLPTAAAMTISNSKPEEEASDQRGVGTLPPKDWGQEKSMAVRRPLARKDLKEDGVAMSNMTRGVIAANANGTLVRDKIEMMNAGNITSKSKQQNLNNMVAASFEPSMISHVRKVSEIDKSDTLNNTHSEETETVYFINDLKGTWKRDVEVMETGRHQTEGVDENMLARAKEVVMVSCNGDLISGPKLQSEIIQSIPSVIASEQSVTVINTGDSNIHLMSNSIE